MKTLFLKSIFILTLFTGFITNNTKTDDTITVVATFDGYDEYGYSFSYTNDEEEVEVITFEEVTTELLKNYNLKDESFIGEEFEITYEYVTSEDEYGDTVEKPVLKSLKKQ